MSEKKRTPTQSSAKKQTMTAPEQLELLFTVVNRDKADFFVDLLQSFEINMQLVLAASGTAPTSTLNLLGITDSEKSVIISVIKRERAGAALSLLGEKFRTVRGGKGIAYTVPMTSIIGVAIYQFLSNSTGGI